ncbi:MAG: ParB N-terminal domain-containing protein [Candidatus Saccharibacteria bacterium]
MNELYDAAINAEADGSINSWLISYLRNSGRNSILAAGLKQDGTYHTGFINYELSKLKLLLGPDQSFRYYEDPLKFNTKVDAMVDSIKDGWRPVPLIATDLWNQDLELSDGAHRAVALIKAGIKTYPTIFYFKNQKLLDNFMSEQS